MTALDEDLQLEIITKGYRPDSARQVTQEAASRIVDFQRDLDPGSIIYLSRDRVKKATKPFTRRP